MPDTANADQLISALRTKFPRAAILEQVTLEDEEELHRQRTVLAARSPHYRRLYTQQGLPHEADIPADYDLRSSVGVRRIDALMLEGKVFTAVEVKISRADFFRDTEAKRGPWLRHTNRFIYLTPAGLVTPAEVPEGCGLWEYAAGEVASVKRATIRRDVVPFPESMMRYLFWRAFSASRTATPRRNRSRRIKRR